MTTRKYSSRSQQTTLASGITDTATSCTVVSGSALLGGATVPAGTTFTVVIDPDTALEEIVDVTVVSTNVLTITRGVENNGTGQAHSPGAAVRHMAIGRDFREANLHIEATGGYNDGTGAHTMHGIAAGEGDVVGTLKTQTLTNKTLTAPTITNPSITGAGVDASIVFEGAVADAHETTLTVAEPTQDNTITLPNTTGTVVIANAAQTLTNKTMGDALNAGGFKITNLATPTLASDAVRKDFADAQVAAAATSAASASTSAASAATSASSALTSANSAATSAANALTSANSAATSASTMAASVTAAASSATAAASSATAAATSATSAAASATAAATSATSAAASATAAATSATSAAASATASANSATASASSATASATSATASASSASAAATSASSALTSQTAAATSATSAAASATAAATSATSAAASATAAATSATSAAASATEAAGYVVPSQTGNAGKFLGTDGTAVSWTNSATSFIPTGSTVPTDGIYLPTTNAIGFATNLTERMRVDANGSVGIGVTPTASSTLTVRRALTGGTSANSIFAGGTVQSDVTSQAAVFSSFPATAAAAFTLSNLIHYQTGQSTIGLGSTVTTQIGFNIGAGLTGATFNFGFHGQLAASSNSRWNAYMVGTAPNYFAGQTTVGSTTLTLGSEGTVAQQFGVVSTSATNIAAVIRGAASQTGDLLQVQNSAATELFTIDSAGKVGIGAASPAGKLHTVLGSTYTIGSGWSGTTAVFATGTTSTSGAFAIAYDDTQGTNLVSLLPGTAWKPLTINSSTTLINYSGTLTGIFLNANGQVGIGTGNPAAKLDVNGSIKSDNLSSVNAILNSQFNVWQRGTTGAGASGVGSGFVADRWQGGRTAFAAGETISRQVTGDTTNLPNIQYCARVQRDSGNTATNSIGLVQNIETVNSIPFAGRTITFSFYARAGANFSASSSVLVATVASGTGTDQNFFTAGFSGQNNFITTNFTLTTTWQRFTASAFVSQSATQLGVSVSATPTGTAGANDWFEVTGVQLELGSVATPYQPNQSTYAAELAACQRYYYRNTASQVFSTIAAGGAARSTTQIDVPVQFPVPLRVAPTGIEFGNLAIGQFAGSASYTVTAASLASNSQSPNVGSALLTCAASLTQGTIYLAFANNNSGAYIAFTAEL
jgi:hypothetical protein